MSKEKLYCHYSDLPSPMAYVKDDHIDYDGMGNQGRIPNIKQKKRFSIVCRYTRWARSNCQDAVGPRRYRREPSVIGHW